jgi:hypothetical protein
MLLILTIAIITGIGYCSNSVKTKKNNVNKKDTEITIKKPSNSATAMSEAKYKATCGQCHPAPNHQNYSKDQWIDHIKRMKLYSKIPEKDMQEAINLWDKK